MCQIFEDCHNGKLIFATGNVFFYNISSYCYIISLLTVFLAYITIVTDMTLLNSNVIIFRNQKCTFVCPPLVDSWNNSIVWNESVFCYQTKPYGSYYVDETFIINKYLCNVNNQ